MKITRLALAVLAIAAIAAVFLIDRNSAPSNPLSAAAAGILSGDNYYLAYTTQWVLADEQQVKIEEAQVGNTFLQQYQVQGSLLTTITAGKRTTVFSEGKLVEEWDNTEEYRSHYSTLRYDGKRGNINIEGHKLFYEEYQYSREGKVCRLRFLFLGEQLWGLQFDRDDRYIQVTSLEQDIPNNLLETIDDLCSP